MKRDILFRGKRVDNGKWHYGSLMIYGEVGESQLIYDNNIDEYYVGIEVIPETVGQFTGLLDQNGVKIFEGDLVKWDDESNGKYWRFAEVKINPSLIFDCSGVKEVDGIQNSSDHVYHYGNFIYRNTEKYIEITGNIHDK